MRLSTFAAVLGIVLSLAAAARGQVLYNTFGSGDTYGPAFTSANFAGYGRNAARFVPNEGGEFNQVQTAIGRFSSGFTAYATVSIVPEATYSGPGGTGALPGVIGVWAATAVDAPLGTTAAIYTFSGPRATLTAGQAYWLLLDASDATNWYNSQPAVQGTTAFRNGSPWVATPGTLPAFKISYANAPSIGSCCNSATGWCAVIARGACETLGLSYGAAGSTCETSPPCVRHCRADFDSSGGLNSLDIFAFLDAWFLGCP